MTRDQRAALAGHMRVYSLVFFLLCITALATALRFGGLGSLAVFVDEDSNTFGAIEFGQSSRFLGGLVRSVSFTEKPPLLQVLQIWLAPPFGSPLIAGRTVSAICGVVTTWVTFAIGLRLGGKTTGVLAALLYAVAPLAVLNDRMATHDSPLTMATASAALLTWDAIVGRSWARAAGAAFFSALAVQFKDPGVFCVLLPCLGMILARRTDVRSSACALLIILATLTSFALLRAGPLGASINNQVSIFLSPFENTIDNIRGLEDIVSVYLPWGLWMAVVAGAVIAVCRRSPFGTYLVAACGIWTLPWPLMSWIAFSRYYLPAVPFACCLAALSIVEAARMVSERRPAYLPVWKSIAAAIIAVSGYRSASIVTHHRTAVLTGLDTFQYQQGWPSGYALDEAGAYLWTAAAPNAELALVLHQRHQIVLNLLSPPRKDIKIHSFLDLRNPILPSTLHNHPLYVLVDDTPDGLMSHALTASHPNLRIERVFRRPGNLSAIYLLTDA